MDDGVDTGGFDASTSSDNDEGESVAVSDNNVEIEISAGDVEIPTTNEAESNIGNPETSVSVTEHFSSSVNVSDTTEYAEWDVESVISAKGIDNMIENLNGVINWINEHSEGTETEKSEDIKANVNETMRNIGLSNMTPEEKVDAIKTVYDSLPERAKANICVPGDVSFLDSETPFDEDGHPNYQWEGNMGFEGKPQECQLAPGQVVDRYGSDSGSYVCEVKNGVPQDYDSRGLPYEENPDMYHQYEIVRDMDDFKSQIENLTVEEIEQMEIQKDLNKPQDERRSPEQIKEDAADRFAAIIYDTENTAMKMYDTASKNGWRNEFGKVELTPIKGGVKESFSYVDEKGNVHKKGGGEQICLPASVDTLVYLGYMKEK